MQAVRPNGYFRTLLKSLISPYFSCITRSLMNQLVQADFMTFDRRLIFLIRSMGYFKDC